MDFLIKAYFLSKFKFAFPSLQIVTFWIILINLFINTICFGCCVNYFDSVFDLEINFAGSIQLHIPCLEINILYENSYSSPKSREFGTFNNAVNIF